MGQLTENQLKECVRNLDYYSCCEQVGAELLSGVLGKEIKHVLDPTFLLNEDKNGELSRRRCKTPKYVLFSIISEDQHDALNSTLLENYREY